MMYPAGMPEYMGWMMFGSYIFWVALIALAVFAVARFTRTTQPRNTARAILDERLARGEINEDEFRARLALLSS